MISIRDFFRGTKKAFSVAEAMVVLLIVSMMLAASAPLISKNMKNSSVSTSEFSVPSGAVMFFYLNKCPQGWTEISQKIPSAAGHFIRIADSSHPNGQVQEQSVQEHWHKIADLYGNDKRAGWTGWGGVWSTFGSGLDRQANQVIRNQSISNAPYVSSDNETRPKNISLTTCIKN